MPQPWDLVVADALHRPVPTVTARRKRTRGLPGKADVAIGMRRSGKTWLFFGEIEAAVRGGMPRDHVLYVSLEDERLANLDGSELGGLLDTWYAAVPSAAREPSWLILDEVQTVPNWDRFVRRILDARHPRISVTGSSAKLLSTEIATTLRGRALSLEVLPFGLDEVLAHRGVAIPQRWPPSTADRAVLQHHADRYLVEGGFPEVVNLDERDRQRILRDYVDVVLLRDVVERHGDSNVPALRRIVRRLASAPATQLSVNKFYNDLKSQGLAVSKDTVFAYFEHVEDAFLAFRVPIRTDSERVRATNPAKTYPIDTGLARAFAARDEPGHLLETAVYLELRRRGGEIAWYKTKKGHEVDFVVQDGTDLRLVQVCWDPTGDARERELRALDEAMEECGVRRGTIVSHAATETVDRAGGTVQVVPAWRWLLDPQGPATGLLF